MSDQDSELERTRSSLSGMRARRRLHDVPERTRREWVERGLDLGLEAASSIRDRNISLFSRGMDPQFAGINTFARMPYVENIRTIGQYDVAVVGVPFDMGTTYRSGARFGPEAVRRISGVYDAYSPDMGMDLLEEIKIGDAGDIFVIPANIEKTFDQVDLGISHILDAGCFPVIIGGDHSIGYPDAKALAKHVDGKLGIIHFDRHIDTAEYTMDERMHTTHWSHATNLANVPPSNLVQIGIGGWIGNHSGVHVAERARHHRHHHVRRRRARRRRRHGHRPRDRVEGRGCGLPVVRHRRLRSRLRPRHRHPGARRNDLSRRPSSSTPCCSRRPHRHGRRRDLTAVRPCRHHRPCSAPAWSWTCSPRSSSTATSAHD